MVVRELLWRGGREKNVLWRIQLKILREGRRGELDLRRGYNSGGRILGTGTDRGVTHFTDFTFTDITAKIEEGTKKSQCVYLMDKAEGGIVDIIKEHNECYNNKADMR